MSSPRPTDPDAQQGADDGPGVRGLAELRRRGAFLPARGRTHQRRDLEGLSLSELADVLAELNSGHGYPAYEEDDD